MKHDNKITPAKPGLDPRIDQSVLTRLAALKAMSVKELKAEWEKLFGNANLRFAELDNWQQDASPDRLKVAGRRF